MSFWPFGKKRPPPPDDPPSSSEPEERSETKLRSDEVLRFALSREEERELLFRKKDGSVHLLPVEDADLLSRCTTFRTLTEHTREIGEDFDLEEDDRVDLRERLSWLMGEGFFISPREVFAKAPKEASPPGRISTVGIVTCDRPDLLARAVESFGQNARRYGHEVAFVVADDSRAPETRERCRALLREKRGALGLQIRYAGPEEKEVFVQALIQEGIPEGVARFALFDVEDLKDSIGTNRNAALLDTLGELALFVDDDTVCRAARPRGAEEALALSSRHDAMEIWFYPDRKTALAENPEVELDVLGEHARCLGWDVSALARDRGGEELCLFTEASAPFTRRLAREGGRVLATTNGILGDSGMGNPFWFLLGLQREAQERFLSSEASFRMAFESREMLRVVGRPTISEGAHCMAGFLGLDNRGLLPPFVPFFRNEDGLFGLSLRLCFSDGYFGCLPFALLHEPPGERSYDLSDAVVSIRMTDILYTLLLDFARSEEVSLRRRRGGAEKLAALGRYLMELGEVPAREFEELLGLGLFRSRASLLGEIERRLRAYPEAPERWTGGLRRHAGVILEAMTRPDFIWPVDVTSRRPLAEAKTLTQRLIGSFGELLCAWPELVAAAKRLRGKGVRLSRVL